MKNFAEVSTGLVDDINGERRGPARAAGLEAEIRIRDNGTGMPEDVRDKIFQPFFTTKALGEGTGLSLSLSFDIVATGHGGTSVAESEEGVGTEFVVTLSA